jgi:hypothetical protein
MRAIFMASTSMLAGIWVGWRWGLTVIGATWWWLSIAAIIVNSGGNDVRQPNRRLQYRGGGEIEQ